MQKQIRTFLLLLLLLALAHSQLAPQFSVSNPVLGSITSYKLSYYSSNNLTTSTTFNVNFNQSNLKIADGVNNCTVKIGATVAASPICTCAGRVCTFKPMMVSEPRPVEIQIGGVTNPMFIYQQTLPVLVYFSPIVSYNYTVIIPPNTYTTMSMTINSIRQSDYGVGYTPVSYQFNISLQYISKNMQMQITIPPEITFSSISSDLSFYSTIQNVVPLQVQSLLIYALQIETMVGPTGFMLLNLSGLGNPRYLGNSSSFKVTFVETTAVANCATCKIAEVMTGLHIESRVPGDVIAVSIDSTNKYIAAVNTLSINLQLYAGIPQGGKVTIFLPPEITPTLPIECGNIYGFIFPDNNVPNCSYNTTANRIDTINFATPYFDSTGNGIISLKVVNPLDSRKVNLAFQTYDSSGRTIGQSRSTSYFTATPLPMNITITKTAQEVDKPYNMSCQIFLTQSLNLSTNYIEIVLPSVVYDLNGIACFSAGQNLNCTRAYDIMQMLVVRFVPPCVQCTAGNSIRFTVVGLKNPSYINDANQQIIVNTRSNLGVIESGLKTLLLTPSAIALAGYSKPTNQVVGTQYDLTMSLNLPDYVKLNGGQIHLLFSPMSVYSDGQVTNLTYLNPSYTLQITTPNTTQILTNTVQYSPDSSPDTISKIIFNICDGTLSVCALNVTSYSFTVKRLRLGYIPALQSTDTIRIATKYGEIIAEKVIDSSGFSPVAATGVLGIALTRSMTNSLSDFQFTFQNTRVVIDKTLTFTLPQSLTINGQCSISASQNFITSFVCTKISSNSISITADFDQDLMISQPVTFTIGVTNVSTSVSMAPLSYVLETSYNGTRNQRFTVRYAMQAPLPLAITYTKSNYTINQQFKLSLSISPITPQYDSYQLTLPKTTLTTQQDWLPTYTLTQNQTHYILTGTGTLPNNYTEIRGRNSLATYQVPQYTVGLLLGGYLVQQASVGDAGNLPVLLGCGVVVTNRTVGVLADMTITCDRNSNGELLDQMLIARLPTNSFSYSSATANGSPINQTSPTASLQITPTSPRTLTLTITSIKNLLYIPNLSTSSPSPSFPSNLISSLQLLTIQDNITKIVGRALINPAAYVPNDAADMRGAVAVRGNVKSGEYTNVTINYQTLYGTALHVMRVTLPAGQNGFVGVSGCFTGPNDDPCSVLDSNSTDMRIALRPNSTITLTKVLNNYPNPNKLSIQILTSPELQLVEQSSLPITPQITLQPLPITTRASTPKIGQPNTLTFQLRPSQLKIQASNIIKITVPPRMFTRAFNSQDCSVRNMAGTAVFTGCGYQYDGGGWLSLVRLGAIGPVDVQIGGLLVVNFTVTNAWTSYGFSGKGFIVTVYKNETSGTSQGTSYLTSIYPNLTSFALLPISPAASTFTQSSLLTASQNTLSITFALLGNIGKGTKIMCLIPKDSYLFAVGGNSTATLEREDSSYYYVSVATVCGAVGCQGYLQQFGLAVQNSYFVKKQKNNVIFYAVYDGLAVSESYVIVTDSQIPQPVPSLTLARTSSTGGQPTTVSLQFTLLPTPTSIPTPTLGQVTIDISSNITNPRYQPTQFSYTQVGQNNQVTQVTGATVSRTGQNITAIVPAAASGLSGGSRVEIVGRNMLEVWSGVQRYWIVVQNATHLLYSSSGISFATKLMPMSQGLLLVRTNTTVGSTTQLRLQGSLPNDDPIDMSQYPLSINNQTYSQLPQTNINYLISASYNNPQTTTNEAPLSLSLCNSTHCIYRQAASPITPALTPIVFTFADVAIGVPGVMNISGVYGIVVNFTRMAVNKSFVRVQVDERLVAAVVGVQGYAYNELLQRIQANTDQMFTLDTANISGIARKTLTIKSKTPTKQINITSLQITFKTPDYQISLPNSQLHLSFQPPSTTHTKTQNILISGTDLPTHLTCTSNKTNQIANYTLTIEAILRTGVLSVQLPEYISGLGDGGTPSFADDTMYSKVRINLGTRVLTATGTNEDNVGGIAGLYLLTYNTTTNTFLINIPLTSTPTTPIPPTLTLTLTNITNPPDNRPLTFTLSQHELQPTLSRIYGYSQVSYKMTVLNPITVFSGVRNMTKIGANISVVLDVEVLGLGADVMGIRMSAMQVLVKGDGYLCQFCVDGTNCTTSGITSDPSTNTITLARHTPGRHNYTLSGCLINSLFSQEPLPGDQLYITLSTPYQTAESTPQTSTYITPLVSTGQIQLLGMSSSSNRRADYTTLRLAVRLENYQNCDGVFLRFDQLAYFVHRNVRCFVNGVEMEFWVVNSSALFVRVGEKAVNLTVEIRNLINYIENKGFVISSMKKKVPATASTPNGSNVLAAQMSVYNAADFGVADQITVTSPPNNFIAYDAQTRVVFPDNYVASGEKRIIAINDYSLPAELPTSTLRYSFSSGELGCSQNLAFNKTISMACQIANAGMVSFTVKLFDTKLSSSSLTSFTKSIYIYPQPKNTCSNVLCDVCSDGANGNQYCFSCREGLFSDNGQCTNDCPVQTFPYQGKTCTECSPQCQECYDIYDNSCLSCRDTTLLLDSGICRNYCSQGYAFQAKFCVNSDQCTSSAGCRLCSATGFCYQCLPDFKGEPSCKYSQILPRKFFIFWMIPFLLLLPIVSIITCIKVGRATFSHMLIYLFSVIQLASWIFVIPKLPVQALAMIMCAFLLLKIIISIIAYETYYSKQISLGKQQRLLAENERQSEEKTDHVQANSKKSKQLVKNQDNPNGTEQTIGHKERLTRFSAHFLSCDAYELLMSKLGKPYMNIKHFVPYFVLTILNRVIVMAFLAYVLSQYSSPPGDLLYVPLIAILSGLAILITRLVTSEKATACLSRIRG